MMRHFDYSEFENRTWDNEILSYIAQIHEYKGKQISFLSRKPVELDRLIEIAKNQSTEASNRIEGIVTTSPRMKMLMADKTTPRTREEEEILGYRNVLNLIHESHDSIPVKPSYILQLHRDMLKFTPFNYAGSFKTVANEIDAFMSDGTKQVIFKPVEPYETAESINELCETFDIAIKKQTVDPLILIPCFILDFLCIHPFNDGNGRISRLITILLLYQSGYEIGKYISIEKAIADTKEAYYDALMRSDRGWYTKENEPKYFIKYMLGIILSCYRDFENRIEIVNQSGAKRTSYDIVKSYALRTIGTFTKQDALENCPSLGSSSVESALKKLVVDGTLNRLGSGRKTHYVRKD